MTQLGAQRSLGLLQAPARSTCSDALFHAEPQVSGVVLRGHNDFVSSVEDAQQASWCETLP